MAVGVVIAGTLAGSVYDHVHRVAADEAVAKSVPAVASGQNQILSIAQWGLQLTAPLAAEMPLLSYANESSQSVGFGSADLDKLGPQCSAGANALGALVREDAGTFGKTVNAVAGSNVVATIGQYEYVYKFSQSSCTDNQTGMAIVNREESILFEALSSLAPVSK